MNRSSCHGAAFLLLIAVAVIGPALAEDAVLRMARADCNRLVAHRSAPDVAYQAGVDVRGRAVVPASPEGANRLLLSDDLLIPLELRLFDRLGGGTAVAEARVIIGTVELRDGRAYFNGQPLDDPTTAELAEKCRGEINRGG